MNLLKSVLCCSFVCAMVQAGETSDDHLIRALNLQQKGIEVLESKLQGSPLAKLYEKDQEFLCDFPFPLYGVCDLPTQGKFYVNGVFDTIKNFLRDGQAWEPDIQRLIRKYAKPGTVAIDIGAHIGTHVLTLSKAVGPHGQVFAFEPSRPIHRELLMNLALNGCENVTPVRCAIGKERGVIDVITPRADNEGGSYVVYKEGKNSAALLSLDEFDLNNVSFIKIDVENLEGDVLDGALVTILANRPVMIVEIQGNLERPIDLKENAMELYKINLQKLKTLGYALHPLRSWGMGGEYLAVPN